MKIFYVTALVLMVSSSAFARQYICNSGPGSEQASLVTFYEAGRPTIQWRGPRAESSKGVFLGVEDSPYMATRGYLVFSLSDFYKTEDSEFRLAISPGRNARTVTAFLYHENDVHSEIDKRYTCTFSTSAGPVAKPLFTPSAIVAGSQVPFLEHIGPVNDRYATSLAMNTPYAPIVSLRGQLQNHLGFSLPLRFFTGFDPKGEAHVTTVTPVEYHDKLRPYVSPKKLSEIALQYNIQSSDLEVLGLGRGSALLNGKVQFTYFVIVRSKNLLRIRHAIYEEYRRNGGSADGWNPNHFFPHITIGYTERDLHEDDGVIKDVEHSLDSNFSIVRVRG